MNSELSTPLMSYREVRFDGRRQFDLYADAIRIRGSATLTSRFEATIPLHRIEPEVNRLFVRNRIFLAGFLIFVVGFGGAGLLVGSLKQDVFDPGPGLFAVLGLAGLFLCLITWRKLEFARFASDSGITVLDVARAGPDRASFDQFVEAIAAQVRLVKKTEAPSASET